MAMLNIGLLGKGGKMGTSIVDLLGQEFQKKCKIIDDLSSAHVIIDFSSPENLLRHLGDKKFSKVPLVSGTTGLDGKTIKALANRARTSAVLWAPNFSLGVAAIKEAFAGLSALSNYDIAIEEIHHSKKKDSPSGTALALQAALSQTLKVKVPTPLFIRGGGDPGTHRILLLGPEETITIEHRALSRQLFARGALQASQWLAKQKPNLYEMKDFLKGQL